MISDIFPFQPVFDGVEGAEQTSRIANWQIPKQKNGTYPSTLSKYFKDRLTGYFTWQDLKLLQSINSAQLLFRGKVNLWKCSKGKTIILSLLNCILSYKSSCTRLKSSAKTAKS